MAFETTVQLQRTEKRAILFVDVTDTENAQALTSDQIKYQRINCNSVGAVCVMV